MANLFELNQALLSCVDEETGEFDFERYEQLSADRNEKIENIIKFIKNLKSDAAQYSEAEKSFEERKEAAKRKAEQLTDYLAAALGGKEFNCLSGSVKFRSSKQTIVDDETAFISWAQNNGREDLLSYKEPGISKTAIKEALAAGAEIPGAHIVEIANISIK